MHRPFEGPIFFMHIPKTAGVSLTRYLGNFFREEEVCPFMFSREYLENIADLGRYRFFHGHFLHFFERLIPERPLLLTFLRDPIARAISAFEHISRPTHPEYSILMESGGSLEALIAHPDLRLHVTDVQTKFLGCRIDDGSLMRIANSRLPIERRLNTLHRVRTVDVTEATLTAAIERLSEFFFVGFQERFQRSLEVLSEKLQVPVPKDIPLENRASDEQLKRRQTAYSERDFESLRMVNQYDIRLYEYARKCFAYLFEPADPT